MLEALRNPTARTELASSLGSIGRAHVPEIFAADVARRLLDELTSLEWRLVIRGTREVFDLDEVALGALDISARSGLNRLLYKEAAREFRYLYDSYRVSDLVEDGSLKSGSLHDLYRFMNSDEGLGLLRQATADERVRYVDMQATRYRPGHFLNTHDDQDDDKQRLYAYVVNLTPVWRAEWGGLLMFLDRDGHIAGGLTPRWNAMNVFRVPQPHFVSFVSPFAEGWRYSLTGWIRAAGP